MTIGNTITKITAFIVLLILFLFMFTILGMEIFANKLRFNFDMQPINYYEIDPPNTSKVYDMNSYSFDYFTDAAMSVFVGLANDGWTTVYFDHARTPAVGNLIAGVFFISLVVVGQMILFNLFLAILLKEFDEGKLMEEAKTEQMGPKKVGCLERCVIKCKGKKVPIKDPSEKYTDVT